jgi:hypothetical protein
MKTTQHKHRSLYTEFKPTWCYKSDIYARPKARQFEDYNLNSISSPPHHNSVSSCASHFFHSVPPCHTQSRRGGWGASGGAGWSWKRLGLLCRRVKAKKFPHLAIFHAHLVHVRSTTRSRHLRSPSYPHWKKGHIAVSTLPDYHAHVSPFHRPLVSTGSSKSNSWPSCTQGIGDLPRPWSQMTIRCSLVVALMEEETSSAADDDEHLKILSWLLGLCACNAQPRCGGSK